MMYVVIWLGESSDLNMCRFATREEAWNFLQIKGGPKAFIVETEECFEVVDLT